MLSKPLPPHPLFVSFIYKRVREGRRKVGRKGEQGRGREGREEGRRGEVWGGERRRSHYQPVHHVGHATLNNYLTGQAWACRSTKAQILRCGSSVQPGEIYACCSKGFNKVRADWTPRIITTKDHFVVFVAILVHSQDQSTFDSLKDNLQYIIQSILKYLKQWDFHSFPWEVILKVEWTARVFFLILNIHLSLS